MKYFLFFFVFMPLVVFSKEKDLVLIAEGKYFSVYAYKNIDIDSLIEKIKLNYFVDIKDIFEEDSKDSKTLLLECLNSLYQEVSDILDIHVYSFHTNVKILSDRSALSQAFKSYVGKEFPERSFYLYDNNTIYISFKDLTLEILAHEIAHAIISRYFVVLPPVKVQEILCGYVEYTLKKRMEFLNKGKKE